MGQIKRDINNITDLKRDNVNVNFVYRGTTLVWQRIVSAKYWKFEGINTVYYNNNADTDSWIMEGINIKFR